MTYNTQLFPGVYHCPQPNMKQKIVARFRRRSEPEAHASILKQLLPTISFTIIDITPDTDETN